MHKPAGKTLPHLQSPRIAQLLESATGENDLPEKVLPEEQWSPKFAQPTFVFFVLCLYDLNSYLNTGI